MSLRGNTAPPDGCPRGRSTAPAGCAAGSRMMNPRSGIGERPWMPPSSCWKSCNFSHEKTLPGRDWQTLAAPGQEAFLTPYLTTVRTGTPGNSGFKSAKKYLIPSVKRRKALQITIKNLVQAFGSRRPGVRVPTLRPPYAEKPPEKAVFLRFLFYFCCLDDCGSALYIAASFLPPNNIKERGKYLLLYHPMSTSVVFCAEA